MLLARNRCPPKRCLKCHEIFGNIFKFFLHIAMMRKKIN